MDYRIEQLRYLLREDPSSRIFFQLGELLRREGDAVQAVEVLKSGLERHPRYVAAWVSLGRSQRDLHALVEAEQAFEKALEIDRENPVAARLLGETAVEHEDWLRAVKAFKLTRALAGGDDELDAQIALVEERLDEAGGLEQPAVEKPKRQPPLRCLEVVSLSSDDPFSAASDETEVLEFTSDVFMISDSEVEDEVDEESAAAAAENADDLDLSGPQEFEEIEAAIGEFRDLEDADDIAPEAPDVIETEAVEDLPKEILVIDESSVGAWSTTMRAAGVSGEEAWTEPTGELMVGEAEVSGDASWIEPTPMVEAATVLPEQPIEAADGGPSEEERPAEIEDEAPPQVEIETFESMEVTHPGVVEQGLVETDASAAEAAEAQAGAEEAARLEAEAEAQAETEREAEEAAAAVEVESVEVAPAVDDEASSDTDTDTDTDTVGERRHELAHGVPLPTMTLAKLALDQDDRPLAMATLESLLERNPSNAEALRLLDELRDQEDEVAREKLRAIQATTKIAALQGWLDAVRLAAERRAP